ncbi:hypothetical protein L195_g060841 [Trifolium pratense]|uniref:Uncharacterized protein n=1 Tax=Trifolium pratense TaxID=57577 RepID=A0A2K3K675_TRIPR|nr:hypothetical protein L195_g060841 [Trifolium pratense]
MFHEASPIQGLENEHLNNVGKYRAFKSVPLPFNHQDDDDEEEEITDT